MTGLLESGFTLIAVVFILALAAERLQEVVKAAFALKGSVRLAGVTNLIREASVEAGFGRDQADVIVARILERLNALNQHGLRAGAVRLDHIGKRELRDLVSRIRPESVPALRSLDADAARKRICRVAANAEAWFDLALNPVDGRHARRMHLGAILSAAVVVVALNADGLAIFQAAWSDASYRDSVSARLAPLLAADSALDALMASRDAATPMDIELGAATEAETESTEPVAEESAPDTALARAVARRDSVLMAALATRMKPFSWDNWTFSWPWLLGVLLTTMLVSLGAPFWHDLLAAVAGLRTRAASRAAAVTAALTAAPAAQPQAEPGRRAEAPRTEPQAGAAEDRTGAEREGGETRS